MRMMHLFLTITLSLSATAHDDLGLQRRVVAPVDNRGTFNGDLSTLPISNTSYANSLNVNSKRRLEKDPPNGAGPMFLNVDRGRFTKTVKFNGMDVESVVFNTGSSVTWARFNDSRSRTSFTFQALGSLRLRGHLSESKRRVELEGLVSEVQFTEVSNLKANPKANPNAHSHPNANLNLNPMAKPNMKLPSKVDSESNRKLFEKSYEISIQNSNGYGGQVIPFLLSRALMVTSHTSALALDRSPTSWSNSVKNSLARYFGFYCPWHKMSSDTTHHDRVMFLYGVVHMDHHDNLERYSVNPSRNEWTLDHGHINVNGKPWKVDLSTIFDTGVRYIYGSINEVVKLYQKLEGARYVDKAWMLPCDKPPAVSFSWESKEGKRTNFPIHDFFVDGRTSEVKGKKYCQGGIRPLSTIPDNEVIFGTLFFYGKYIMFSPDHKQLSMMTLPDGASLPTA
ncbi:hypothetical protein APHAL10511_005311 [Amanita phalloides]|nr:hypothetical protein APHAL10511_005311 [Amanita phalloides]